MVDLIETLWDILLGNHFLRWFFIGLLIGLFLVGYLIWSGSSMEATDALMGIVVTGFLVLAMRVVFWFFSH
ncbi:hypothetical protein GBZ48_35585 [Azospirillum melinis]|uniref:Uncharacterized protein n=1 Tax=Azospirillum melinis TaxID=328839 RepID=A0ABX2KLK0_9PROT|nr:hypothetical protein [Azospirillum melinis]MBP2310704.1 hypothetical protein [Azospirillum melinis]NUB04517.1 hypothetical protein [Azospirillum melinis]